MSLKAAAALLTGVLATEASAGLLPSFSWIPSPWWPSRNMPSCISVESGYNCNSSITHWWGDYGPYFSVPSDISADVPLGCDVNFVQLLSRHGARYPDSDHGPKYAKAVSDVFKNVDPKYFVGQYAFLNNYNYTLPDSGELTTFGEKEMYDSGIKFFARYPELTLFNTPFFRSSASDRVVMSAQNFSQAYHAAKSSLHLPDPTYPYDILIIPEETTYNSTLLPDTCPDFESGPDSDISGNSEDLWEDVFVPAIADRLNTDLPGNSLSEGHIVDLMDTCTFETMASPSGTTLSPWCTLFTDDEWVQYNYEKTLNRFYGDSYGNPLGPAQGAGWVNELIARLTDKPVVPPAAGSSINTTLDANPATFPLGMKIYADFTHDHLVTWALSAMGMWNLNAMLSNDSLTSPEDAAGYAANWVIPYSSRVYVEKMSCLFEPEEMVRVILNDRVQPMTQCGGDSQGRCTLSKFLDSLSYAKAGAGWAGCYA